MVYFSWVYALVISLSWTTTVRTVCVAEEKYCSPYEKYVTAKTEPDGPEGDTDKRSNKRVMRASSHFFAHRRGKKVKVDWPPSHCTCAIPHSGWFDSLVWSRVIVERFIHQQRPKQVGGDGDRTTHERSHWWLNTVIWVCVAEVKHMRGLQRGRHYCSDRSRPGSEV